MPQQPGKLNVEVDLRIDLDGQTVLLSGTGNHLVLHAQCPTDLVAAVLGTELPKEYRHLHSNRALGALADSLHRAGLELLVTGPSGPLLTLGDGQRWRWGTLTTGSVHVRPGRMTGLLPLLADVALRQLRHSRPLNRAAAVGATLVTVLGPRLRRRS